MRKVVLSGLIAFLVVGLAVPDASACRWRRHRSCTCPCSGCISCPCTAPCKPIMRVSVLHASCKGGDGTYSAPDTKILGVYFQNQAGTSFPCQFSYSNGTWQTTSVPALQPGTYKLCATGDKSGSTCSASFNCP